MDVFNEREYLIGLVLLMALVALSFFTIPRSNTNELNEEPRTFEARIVSFKSDGIDYEYSFIDKDNKVQASKEIKFDTSIIINDSLPANKVLVRYEYDVLIETVIDPNGKIVSKEMVKESPIESGAKVELEMNTWTFKHGKRE